MTTNEWFDKMSHERVMIVGDVMTDNYMWGNVTRISPEAPVPVVSVTKRERRLGGAANVALNIESMGAMPIICSVLGDDDNGKDFLQIMYRNNMDRRGIVTSDNRMTTVKSRVIGNNAHIVRVDEENTHPLSTIEEDHLLERIGRTIKAMPVNAIIFQDYDKGCITPRIIEEVTTIANRKKILTTVDPKHRNFAAFKNVSLFKPNLKELREGLNIEIDASLETHLETPTTASLSIFENSLFLNEYSFAGAGDTVISVITLALAAGMDLEQAVRFANTAGGIVCGQVGVVPIERDRLANAL